MKALDLASALTAPVPGRGAQERARSVSPAGTTDTHTFEAVLSGVQGARDTPRGPTPDSESLVADDTAAQDTPAGGARHDGPCGAATHRPAGPDAGSPAAQDPFAAAAGSALGVAAALHLAVGTPASAGSVAAETSPGTAGSGVPTPAGHLQSPGPAGAAAAGAPGPAAAPGLDPRLAGQAAPLQGTVPSSSAGPPATVAVGAASGAPVPVLAAGSDAVTARPEHTPVQAPAAAPAEALAAAGAAAAPASQPASSVPAGPVPAPPAPSPPGAALQPQLAKPLFTLAGAPQGQHIMTLQVNPEDLGPMTVRAHIDAAGVRIELFAPGDAGREAIRGILPELRKELADAGFGASLDVSEHTGPGSAARDGTSRDPAGGNGTRQGGGPDTGPDPGDRNRAGDQRSRHRGDALAEDAALRTARILNGPHTSLDILV